MSTEETLLEITNADRTPTKLAYYRELSAGGITYDIVTLLPGLNLVGKEEASKVGIGGEGFPYSHIEETKASSLPVSAAVELANRSVATDALSMWLLEERRPLVREAIQSKLKQRTSAMAREEEAVPSSEEMPNGFGV